MIARAPLHRAQRFNGFRHSCGAGIIWANVNLAVPTLVHTPLNPRSPLTELDVALDMIEARLADVSCVG